jgi:hypothetical protein
MRDLLVEDSAQRFPHSDARQPSVLHGALCQRHGADLDCDLAEAPKIAESSALVNGCVNCELERDQAISNPWLRAVGLGEAQREQDALGKENHHWF